jgi:hypothetical protein
MSDETEPVSEADCLLCRDLDPAQRVAMRASTTSVSSAWGRSGPIERLWISCGEERGALLIVVLLPHHLARAYATNSASSSKLRSKGRCAFCSPALIAHKVKAIFGRHKVVPMPWGRFGKRCEIAVAVVVHLPKRIIG